MNVLFRSLEDFSNEELELAQLFSLAICRYLRILAESKQVAREPSDPLLIRHRAWVECALNTLFKTSSTQTICRNWSLQTDQIVQSLWQDHNLSDYPLALFALGKWGSLELNLSSDIDLILVTEDQSEVPLKQIKNFGAQLSVPSDRGFLYRTDYDLRPGGPSSSLVTTVSQFINHYWSFGESWERLALIRLRPITGSTEVINQVKEAAKKFTYRKYLDYSLYDAFSDLKSKIQRNQMIKDTDDLDIKLSSGGIREIELFVHALATIHGGRSPSLQEGQTQNILEELTNLGVIKPADRDLLSKHYWSLRHFENLMQLKGDLQTHRFSYAERNQFISESHFAEFTLIKKEISEYIDRELKPHQSDSLNASPPLQAERIDASFLNRLGLSHEEAEKLLPSISKINKSILGNERSKSKFESVIRLISEETPSIDLRPRAITFAVEFIRSLKAPTSTISLLAHHPNLVKDLAQVFSRVPYLSQILCSRPELLDEFVFRQQELIYNDADELMNGLFDRKLVSEMLAAIRFLRNRNLSELTDRLTHTADEISHHLSEFLKQDLGLKREVQILALGKWGSRELGLRSDLDLIFVVEDGTDPNAHRFARKFIAFLTSPLKGGRLFDVDLSLRPNGNSGPLIVSKTQIRNFLNTTAKAWQLQSYLRARSLDGPNSLIDFSFRALVASDWQDLREIRQKLIRNPKASDHWSLKLGAGGLVDIELCLQSLVLEGGWAHHIRGGVNKIIDGLKQASPHLEKDLNLLGKHYDFLREVEQMTNLLFPTPQSSISRHQLIFGQVADALCLSNDELTNSLNQTQANASQLVKALDPCYQR